MRIVTKRVQKTPSHAVESKRQAPIAPYLLLAGAQLAVGAAAIFARLALGGAGPLAVAAARLCVAAAVLAPFALLRRDGRAPSPSPPQRGALVLAGIALAVHFAGWIASLEYTTVAVSTLLVATTPLWTAIYETAVRGRRLSRPAMLAFAGGAVGLAAVAGLDTAAPPQPGHQLLGAALALCGSLAMAAYLTIVRDARGTLDTTAIVSRTYLWAGLALVAGAAAAHQPLPPLADASAWAGILAMALVSQLLGHTAINASLRWFSASTVSFTNLLEPVAAGILALLVFGEALSPPAIAGAVLLLGSIAIVLREEALPQPDGEV